MDLIKQKGKKVGPITDVMHKFKYSFQGLVYCYKNETSFIFITLALIAATVFGIIFEITFMEWIFTIGSLLLVITVELLNTAIEAVVDMFTSEYNEYAKVAKDCGSAATSIVSFLTLAINLIIFLPRILPLIFR